MLKSYLSDWFKWNQHANSGQVWREQKAYEKFVARSMFNQMNRNVAVAAIFFMFAQVNRNKFYSFSKSLVRIRLQQYGKLHGIHSKDACCELHRFHFRWTLRGHIECARFKAIYSSFFLSLYFCCWSYFIIQCCRSDLIWFAHRVKRHGIFQPNSPDSEEEYRPISTTEYCKYKHFDGLVVICIPFLQMSKGIEIPTIIRWMTRRSGEKNW